MSSQKKTRKLLTAELKTAVNRCFMELEQAYPILFKKDIGAKVAYIFSISEWQVQNIIATATAGKALQDPKKSTGRPILNIRNDVVFKEELAIRIHYYHKNNMYFTMEDLYQYARTELNYEYSKSTLYSVVHSMGYRYKKVNGRKLLVESPRLLSRKIFFLRKYQQYLESNVNFIFIDETWIYQNGCAVRRWVKDGDPKGNPSKVKQDGGKRFTILHAGCRSVGFLDGCSFFLDSKIDHQDYHKTMNAEVFTKWVVDQLLPAVKQLNGKFVVVMDNAPYHSAVVDKPPNSNATKTAMQNWLLQHNVYFESGYTKKELYSLIKPITANIDKTYVIDELLKQNNIDVLRLPPYHCQYNPIELAWGQCKQYYNKHVGERSGRKESVQVLWEEALSLYGASAWTGWVEHCEKLIKNDWKRLMGEMSYRDIPPFIISLGESDSESESTYSDTVSPDQGGYLWRDNLCEMVDVNENSTCSSKKITETGRCANDETDLELREENDERMSAVESRMYDMREDEELGVELNESEEEIILMCVSESDCE